MALTVRVLRLHPEARLPTCAHEGPHGDLCADLYAVEGKQLVPGGISQIRTGIALELPEGYGALVEHRSGLALKGVFPIGGVVDTGYRGELIIILANVGKVPIVINMGDRIAQIRLVQRFEVTFEFAETLADSSRSNRGFGSTGK